MDLFGEHWLAARVLLLVPVLLSLTVHEFAHAWTAFRLGDYTAASQGRLTLDPLAHIDPLGLLLPLLGVPFGWAKPVPVNLGAIRRGVSMRQALVLTAAAGPISNLLLALAATVVLALAVRLGVGASAALMQLLEWMVLINLLLAFFNLLPIPPLDGGRVAEGLCPPSLRNAWSAFTRVGPLALVAVLVLPIFFGTSLFAGPIAHTQVLLGALFEWLAGS